MTKDATLKDNKENRSSSVKKSILIKSTKKKVWEKISDIADMDWVAGVKKTVHISKIKRGIGAGRKIILEDGNVIKEYVVGWNPEKYFSYIATSGLPLRAYHATISIEPNERNFIKLVWKSYFNSEPMTEVEFTEFVSYLQSFYESSLKKLKIILEK